MFADRTSREGPFAGADFAVNTEFIIAFRMTCVISRRFWFEVREHVFE